MSEEDIQKAEYPWEDCIADQKANGYSDEQAQRICAAIKNRTVAHKVAAENLPVEKALESVISKAISDTDFQYILDKLVKAHAHASKKEAEGLKGMTKEETKPPGEAKKQEEPAAPGEVPEEPGNGGNGTEAKLDTLLAMMEKVMAAMGGGAGAPVQAAQKAETASQTEKPLTKADVELLIKQKLAEKAAEDPDSTTPRPPIKKQNEIAGGAIVELMKDPDRLAKMSFEEIDALTEQPEEVGL